MAEQNFGAELVAMNLRAVNPSVPVKLVHASRGKAIRAEPISSMDQQGRIHHVGYIQELETQMTTWDPNAPGESPDRVDARVWAFTELLLKRLSIITQPAATRRFLPIYQH